MAIRTPVKLPGPMPTAMRSKSGGARPACRQNRAHRREPLLQRDVSGQRHGCRRFAVARDRSGEPA